MHEPPAHVGDQDVLDTVRATWLPDADTATHLPVGFGAHHWAASVAGERRLFVTLDGLGDRRSTDSLTAAYRAAATLAADGLEFVHASLPPLTVPFADDLLSATPWVDGHRPERLDREVTSTMLARLHATPPPEGTPRWRPLVGPDLAEDLACRARTTWDGGPFSARAQAALRSHLAAIDTWVTRYHRLAEEAASRPVVPTHGEPDVHNQLLTDRGTLLVDWESLQLAPAERDLRALDAGGPMTEMFDLEWRLDEVQQYAERFQQPHTGGADDLEAVEGLVEELERPDWHEPSDRP
ncbi:hypothetical protein NPS01_32300 [Nocardioides psychrotolerans]|uniref:Spectinomycin phosphotransferase n=1 Tax=Nocardioides psychrotolerans TaxID=1005945 RepID=A0A1I3P0C8_9ACTN|nr:hypothetical protein [Nocardioides psychrotolerans]GEP39567.1 hypothetical protein NPS01_32300 [Nocardioides psychrotolerans]SFJ14901.1 spectinomycin phosphotransferase [Nocardioides psychrotolerans]